jgi:hypothetical protein
MKFFNAERIVLLFFAIFGFMNMAEGQIPESIRVYLTNLTGEPASGRRSERHHFVFTEKPTKAWLDQHTYGGSPGNQDGDFCCGTWYDGNHGRFFSRSLNLFEEEDPADLRGARRPANPNECLPEWTEVFHLGSSDYDASTKALMHYGASIDFFKSGKGCSGQIGISIATAPGVTSQTRYSGLNEGGQHLVSRLVFFPNGDIIANFNSPSGMTRPPRFIVAGDLYYTRLIEYRGDPMHLVFDDDTNRANEARINLQKIGQHKVN